MPTPEGIISTSEGPVNPKEEVTVEETTEEEDEEWFVLAALKVEKKIKQDTSSVLLTGTISATQRDAYVNTKLEQVTQRQAF